MKVQERSTLTVLLIDYKHRLTAKLTSYTSQPTRDVIMKKSPHMRPTTRKIKVKKDNRAYPPVRALSSDMGIQDSFSIPVIKNLVIDVSIRLRYLSTMGANRSSKAV